MGGLDCSMGSIGRDKAWILDSCPIQRNEARLDMKSLVMHFTVAYQVLDFRTLNMC